MSATVSAPLDLTRMGITEEELNSEVELLRDHDVLRKVVEQNRSGGRDWLHVLHLREGRAQRIERATRRLAEQLRIQPVKKTNLIAISYRPRMRNRLPSFCGVWRRHTWRSIRRSTVRQES